MKTVLTAAAIVLSIPLNAQVVPGFDSVLLPIVVGEPVPGAFESLWVTELAITNSSSEVVKIDGIRDGCTFQGCPTPVVIPWLTIYPGTVPFGNPGMFLKIESGKLDEVEIELRVRDLSRSAESWGTEIPVVPISRGSSRVSLVDVPVDSDYRVLIRIYDLRPTIDREVDVRIFEVVPRPRWYDSPEPDRLLHETSVTLLGGREGDLPGVASLSLSEIEALPSEGRIRIVVSGLTTDARLWAMASVTNNETQEVTLITPFLR